MRAEEFLEFSVLVRHGDFFLNSAGVGFFELHYLFFESSDVNFFALAVSSAGKRVSQV